VINAELLPPPVIYESDAILHNPSVDLRGLGTQPEFEFEFTMDKIPPFQSRTSSTAASSFSSDADLPILEAPNSKWSNMVQDDTSVRLVT